MKRNQWKNVLPCLWSTGGILVFSASLLLLYRQSQYLLFSLGGIFLLLLAVVNLLLLIFGLTVPQEKKLSENETAAEENEQDQKDPRAEDGVKAGRLLRGKKRDLRALLLKCARAALSFYEKLRTPLQLILLAFVLVGGSVWFGSQAWSTPLPGTLAYWHLVVLVAAFVLAIVLDKLCKHTQLESHFFAFLLRNARAFFALSKLILAVLALSVALRILNIFDLQKYLVYGLTALFYYVCALILLSLAVRLLRKEMTTAPGIVIFLPFLNADIKELAVVSFLEENTGITLRSLWSIKYVRSILPYTVFIAALLFWLSTGVVYVQSHQEAAVYRLGSLQQETLEPGLHFRLPAPFETAEIYNTKTINKITVGYKATENIDNVWTETHGDDEYKLLLGSGNELVSINLRVEYRIGDLKKYLSIATEPDKLLEAKAYELITDRTINTDLDTLLSANRETFANTLHAQLVKEMEALDLGIEVVNLIMESIHPPVEVAQVYQDFIGAEIDAERLVLEAQAAAVVAIADAEMRSHDMINVAQTDHYQKLAGAKTEIAEFMAAVEASNQFPDEYSYYKYLEAIGSAYQKAKLIIIGEGVDGTRLYYGNLY